MNKDDKLKKTIEAHLEWNSMIDHKNINIEVTDGLVKVTGTVPFFIMKREVSKSIWEMDGVMSVKNKLKIVYPDWVSMPTDKEIQLSIQNSLLWNSYIFACDIHVEVINREVFLYGSVDTLKRKIIAENLAGLTLGVQNITNKITVDPFPILEDQDVDSQACNALRRYIGDQTDNINIKVLNGMVTLDGYVTKWPAKRTAEKAVKDTKGVKDVKSEIQVKYKVN